MQFDRDRTRPTRQAPPQIELRGLTKRFGPILALNDINLTIGRGELFSLVGSSGCGKTTLLRSLAGFVKPDSGQIIIGGEDMAPVRPDHPPGDVMVTSY